MQHLNEDGEEYSYRFDEPSPKEAKYSRNTTGSQLQRDKQLKPVDNNLKVKSNKKKRKNKNFQADSASISVKSSELDRIEDNVASNLEVLKQNLTWLPEKKQEVKKSILTPT